MKQIIILTTFLTTAFLNAYAQLEDYDGNRPCKTLTEEVLQTQFENSLTQLSEGQTYDTLRLIVEDIELKNLERLSDWSIENKFDVKLDKDVDLGEGGVVHLLHIGMNKKGLALKDLIEFVDVVQTAKKKLAINSCLDAYSLRSSLPK
jgi:hypothetical protein